MFPLFNLFLGSIEAPTNKCIIYFHEDKCTLIKYSLILGLTNELFDYNILIIFVIPGI